MEELTLVDRNIIVSALVSRMQELIKSLDGIGPDEYFMQQLRFTHRAYFKMTGSVCTLYSDYMNPRFPERVILYGWE